jgi:hypothetical protein
MENLFSHKVDEQEAYDALAFAIVQVNDLRL